MVVWAHIVRCTHIVPLTTNLQITIHMHTLRGLGDQILEWIVLYIPSRE